MKILKNKQKNFEYGERYYLQRKFYMQPNYQPRLRSNFLTFPNIQNLREDSTIKFTVKMT